MSGSRSTPTTRLGTWVAAALFAVGIGAVVSGGHADAAIACTTRTTTKAFATWGDQNAYFAIPNGTFESTSGWVNNGTSTVTPNEPWKVVSSLNVTALQIRSGATAISPQFCVGSAEDALRLFVKLPGISSALLHVHIDVVSGVNRATNDYDVSGGGTGWTPTQRIMLPDIRDASGQQLVTITFSTRGTAATWVIDDVMLDPWRLV